MADEPQAPPAAESEAPPAPAPTAEPASPLAELLDAMAERGEPTPEPTEPSEGAAEGAGAEPASPPEASQKDEPEETDEERQWSRRELPRKLRELEQTVSELKAERDQLKGQVDERSQQDAEVTQALEQWWGPEQEYQQAREGALLRGEYHPDLPRWEENRRVLGALLGRLQHQVDQRTAAAYRSVYSLEGVDSAALEQAPSLQDGMTALYQMARKVERDAAQGEIAELKSELSALRARLAGRGVALERPGRSGGTERPDEDDPHALILGALAENQQRARNGARA